MLRLILELSPTRLSYTLLHPIKISTGSDLHGSHNSTTHPSSPTVGVKMKNWMCTCICPLLIMEWHHRTIAIQQLSSLGESIKMEYCWNNIYQFIEGDEASQGEGECCWWVSSSERSMSIKQCSLHQATKWWAVSSKTSRQLGAFNPVATVNNSPSSNNNSRFNNSTSSN